MQRKVLNFAAVLSLALSVATVALWVRGAWINDIVARYSPAGSWDIQSWHGRLMLHTSNDPGDSPPARTSWWPRPVTSTDADSPAFQRSWWNRVGFVYLSETYPARHDDYLFRRTTPPIIRHDCYVGVPLWLVAFLGVVLPASKLFRWRRRYRLVHSLCGSCGYDLRATPDRCPECGSISGPAPRTAA
jgi:hypothetical protein